MSVEQQHKDSGGQKKRISGFIKTPRRDFFRKKIAEKRLIFLNEAESVVLCTSRSNTQVIEVFLHETGDVSCRQPAGPHEKLQDCEGTASSCPKHAATAPRCELWTCRDSRGLTTTHYCT